MIKRFLFTLIAYFMSISLVFATTTYTGVWINTAYYPYPATGITGVTYFNDFQNPNSSINADYSVGSATSTFTRTNVNATYITSAGLVGSVAVANTPRITYGYADSTGIHLYPKPGLMNERAVSNLSTYSYTYANAVWAKTNVTVSDASFTAPDGTSNASTLTATADGATLLRTTAATGKTYSVWLYRKTGTGTISMTANSGATWTPITLISGWARFQVTATSALQTYGIKFDTSGDEVYAWVSQYEVNMHMTSTIINVTSALTRGVENFAGVISGNRTAAAETIFIKFAPIGGPFMNTGLSQYLTTTSTVQRPIYKSDSLTTITARGISTTSGYQGSITPSANTIYTFAFACQATGNPNSIGYWNGVRNPSNDENTDFTAPAWGTTFYIGASGGSASDCVIFSFLCVDHYLTATEVALISGRM